MENNTTNSPYISLHKRQYKDRAFILQFIRNQVENGTGKNFVDLKTEYTEDKLFYISLKYVTTTKKALCEAMGIPVEAGCRYKRSLEKNGQLVQSVDEFVCPLTMHKAHHLSTNPKEFKRLLKSNDSQLKMFDDEE